MDIVVTHASADFDAFAAAIAACKLYPGARAVMTRGLARGVRELATLHRDRFPWCTPRDVDPRAVRRLVIVDVRRAARLRPDLPELLARLERGDPTLEVHVWDHHPASDDDVRADVAVVEPVGSATTLLVEAMRARGVSIDPVEATLFALGIHSDTGSLQYATSSPRDAEALAHLYSRGASLRVMRRFLEPPFTAAQRAALVAALDAIEIRTAGGLRVALASIELARPVEGLDGVASELFRLEQPHALFLIAAVPSRARAHVVARAREGSLDVGAIARALGGGGHASAAAVARSGVVGGIAAVRADLIATLDALPVRTARVRELMSSPVRTIAPDHPLGRLRDELPLWGHTGVPVVQRDALVGIVSTDDLERAEREGRLHLAAGSCMSHPVRTISLDATLDDALDAMTRHGIGRLPVVRAGELVGIVTRRDVRAALYGVAGAERDASSAATAPVLQRGAPRR